MLVYDFVSYMFEFEGWVGCTKIILGIWMYKFAFYKSDY
jgi:hypothetical protein